MEARIATIHTRISPSLKLRAERIFATSGHTTSDVLEQFYAQTVRLGKVPIRLTKRRAVIPDESTMTVEEIKAILNSARVSAHKQIASEKYITTEAVRKELHQQYGLAI